MFWHQLVLVFTLIVFFDLSKHFVARASYFFFFQKSNCDTNSMKHLKDKINELQVENKHLKDQNRILSKIIDLIYNNGSINNSNLGS